MKVRVTILSVKLTKPVFLVNLDFDRKTGDLPKLRVNFKIETNQKRKIISTSALHYFNLLKYFQN